MDMGMDMGNIINRTSVPSVATFCNIVFLFGSFISGPLGSLKPRGCKHFFPSQIYEYAYLLIKFVEHYTLHYIPLPRKCNKLTLRNSKAYVALH